MRYFHATFADLVDVAILSESTTRTSTIKQDLALLGMSYTQYEIDDWNDYLTTTWILKYNKVVLPWQTAFAAKDIGAGGLGYYEKLGDNKDTLENFMDAGGTIQATWLPWRSSVRHWHHGPAASARFEHPKPGHGHHEDPLRGP